GKASGALGKVFKRSVVGVGLAAGGALGTALFKGWQRLSAIEDAQAKLKGLGHSAGSVQKIMDNALASVKGTAFGLDEAASVAASAVAAGIKPGADLERVLSLVGDTASIAGVSMGEMGSIFNKVAANGKLTTAEVNQLADRGVPILQMLADQYGVTAQEAAAMVSSGQVDFAAFSKALETNIGGAALASGETTSGAFKNMGAAAGRFGAQLLQGIFPIAKQVFGGVTTLLDESGAALQPWIEAFSGWLTSKAVPAAQALIDKVGDLADSISGFFASQQGQALKTDTFDRLKSIFGTLSDAASRLAPAIGTIVASLATATASIGISTWTVLLATIDALATVANVVLVPAIQLLAALMEHNQGVVTALVAAYGAFKFGQLAASIYTSTGALVKNTAAWIANSRAAATANIAKASSAWDTLRLKAMFAGDAMKAVGTKIATAATAAASAAASVGRLALAYMKAGIQAAASAVKMVAVKTVQLAIRAATLAWMAAQWLLNAALTANPIGLIIVALIAAAVLIIYYWDEIVAGLTAAWEWLVTLAASVWQSISDGVVAAWDFIVGLIVGYYTMLWTTAVTIFNAIVDAISGAWEWVKSTATAAWTAVWSAISGAWGWIKSTVQSGVNFVLGHIAFLASLPGKAAAWFGGLLSAAVAKFQSLISWAKSVPGKILSALGNVGSKLLSAGRNLIDGLLRGMKNAWSAVKSWILNALSGIKDSVLDFFGISSPSKMAIYWGEMVGDGLARGLAGSAPTVESSTDVMMRAAVPDLGTRHTADVSDLESASRFTLADARLLASAMAEAPVRATFSVDSRQIAVATERGSRKLARRA
ncbi:MAG: phage tail protein, partial [Stackebrandtia sp.]